MPDPVNAAVAATPAKSTSRLLKSVIVPPLFLAIFNFRAPPVVLSS
jgi:hypothetical protein